MEDSNISGLLIFFLVFFIWLILPAVIAKRQGRSVLLWLLLGAIFPIIVFIALALLPKQQRQAKHQKKSSKDGHGNTSLETNQGQSNRDGKKERVLDISRQPIGSLEFEIEVASASVASGLSLDEFAKKFNIDAASLNKWKETHLGSKIDNGSSGEADNNVKKVEKSLSESNSISKSSSADLLQSNWIDASGSVDDNFKGGFALSLTNFTFEGPDEDGDVSMDIEFRLENSSEVEISLIKKNLVIGQPNLGAIAGEINEREDCLLDPGEDILTTSWVRLNQNYIDRSEENVDIELFASFYSSEFIKLDTVDVPAKADQTTFSAGDVSSELINPNIKIVVLRSEEVPYDEDEEDPKEDKLELKISIENQSKFYVEDIEARVLLVARNGAEIDETSDQLDVLAPHSGAVLQPSFWGIKRSKLKDSKINVSIKAHRLVGTQILKEKMKLGI